MGSRANSSTIAYDYVEVTREVLNDEDVDHDVEVVPTRFDSRKEVDLHKSIPLMDARMFGNHTHVSNNHHNDHTQ